MLNKGLKKHVYKIVTVILIESILPTLLVFWYLLKETGDLEAAKQITEVCGQMVMTLPFISKKSVVVPSTQLQSTKGWYL